MDDCKLIKIFAGILTGLFAFMCLLAIIGRVFFYKTPEQIAEEKCRDAGMPSQITDASGLTFSTPTIFIDGVPYKCK